MCECMDLYEREDGKDSGRFLWKLVVFFGFEEA